MWVSGRKTKGPNVAPGFSTFSSCLPWNKAEKSQPPHQSVFCFSSVSCMSFSKVIEVRWRELHGKRQKERTWLSQTVSDLLTYNDLFSKRCNNWQDAGFCLWLFILQSSNSSRQLLVFASVATNALKKAHCLAFKGRSFEASGLRISHSPVQDIFVRFKKHCKNLRDIDAVVSSRHV